MSNPKNNNGDSWGSQLGVVLAVAGCAVGLGNFLRFPGQVANNGGGAFMIPYLVALLVVAVPIAMSEWALGRYAGRCGFHSPAGAYYVAGGRKARWGIIGGLTTCAPFVVSMYYVFIEAWCLVYAAQYLGGLLGYAGLGFTLFQGVEPGVFFESGEGYEGFFNQLVGIEKDGTLFRSAGHAMIGATFVCVLANFLLVFKGVSRGIERFCKAAAPLILVCAIAVIIRVVTLGNPTGAEGQSFLDGLGFMWNPTREIVDAAGETTRTNVFDALLDANVWLAATSQIFFSISICLGAVCTYASYVKPRGDVALSSLMATSVNELCEVGLGGLMTIPAAIMFLGARAADGFASSFSLGFIVLPNVFGLMPLGQFWGFVFFFLLLLAAVTSSISMLQPTVALLQESLRWTREQSASAASTFSAIGTLIICWFTFHLGALDVFDFWVANFLPLLTAFLQTALILFVWGVPALKYELALGARVKPPKIAVAILRWVSLPYLALVVLLWLKQNMFSRIAEIAQSQVAQISLGFMGLSFAIIIALVFVLIRRWNNAPPTANDAEKNL